MNKPGALSDLDRAPDGRPFVQATIGSGSLRASVLSFGAALRDLRISGHDAPLVLGYADPTAHFTNRHKLGVIVGRCANRIAGGRFELNRRTYELDRNEGGFQCLHGGRDGTSEKSWAIADRGPDHVTLSLTLEDGHMGFPGTLAMLCTYRIDGATLGITLRATSDADTYCNLASHIYYNLDGAMSTEHHQLSIAADHYLAVNERQIPLPAPKPVTGTDLDFRQPRCLASPLDHNFCVSDARRDLTPVAELQSPTMRMTLASTEPGLQVYDGEALDITGHVGLEGHTYGRHAGVALEPQAWPDAPNQSWADQALLRPGRTYESVTRLGFESR